MFDSMTALSRIMFLTNILSRCEASLKKSKNFAFSRYVMASEIVNAFMTIRVGILTKKYLFSADGPIEMPQARKDSYKEAIDFLKKCELT